MSNNMELQAMLSTAMLAINELNKKHDIMNETIKTMGGGYDIKTIISNSLESVSELSKKYDPSKPIQQQGTEKIVRHLMAGNHLRSGPL
jgi:acetoin utilization deacetylase AcuC-like enzyme